MTTWAIDIVLIRIEKIQIKGLIFRLNWYGDQYKFRIYVQKQMETKKCSIFICQPHNCRETWIKIVKILYKKI